MNDCWGIIVQLSNLYLVAANGLDLNEFFLPSI